MCKVGVLARWGTCTWCSAWEGSLVGINHRLTVRVFFFFQAEDGIRDGRVTGVQTCALPISPPAERVQLRSRLTLKLSSGLCLGMAQNSDLQIGELARAAGVSVEAVRFYEKQGLLPKPRRRASG